MAERLHFFNLPVLSALLAPRITQFAARLVGNSFLYELAGKSKEYELKGDPIGGLVRRSLAMKEFAKAILNP